MKFLVDLALSQEYYSKIKRLCSGSPVRVWLVLRFVTIAVASLALLYEQRSSALRSVSRLLLSPWYNYDAIHYVQIVKNGYRTGDITSGFHPLYPWLATIVSWLFRDPLISLLVTSSVAGFLFVIIFFYLAKMDLNEPEAWTATTMCLLWPSAFALFAPYTESLFLVLAASCLFALRRKRYLLAGIAGGLAALTRQHGILLTIPIAWELWENSDRNLMQALRTLRRWLSILFVPLGYGLWILYRAFAISDVRPDFSNVQSFIYSVMVSKAHYSVFQDQQFLPPWDAIWRAGKILFTQHIHWSAYGDVLMASLFVMLFAYAWRYLRTSYRLYSISVVLIGLSFHTGSEISPYVGLPRHMLPAFPVFIGVAAGYKFSNPVFVFVIAGICQMLVLCCYVWETWVP